MSFDVTVSNGATLTATVSGLGVQGPPGILWSADPWTLGTAYVAGDGVEHDGSSYRAIADHTAASTNEPGVGVGWEDDWAVVALAAEQQAETITVAQNIADVVTVAGAIGDVSTVAAAIVDVGTVASNIADVGTVASNIADVSSVADNMAAVLAVEGLAGQVSADAAQVAADLLSATSEADTAQAAQLAAETAATNAAASAAVFVPFNVTDPHTWSAKQTFGPIADENAIAASNSVSGAGASSILDLAAVWNTSGAPSAIYLDVTDTASDAASRLLDLRVGGSSKFRVGKSGQVIAGAGADGIHIETSGGASNRGFGQYGSRPAMFYGSASIPSVALNSGKLALASDWALVWASTSDPILGAVDLILARDAANVLAQRNGVNAQAFRLYNTYTDASNYERGGIRWNGNVLELFTSAAGTGTARGIKATSDAGSNFDFFVNAPLNSGTATLSLGRAGAVHGQIFDSGQSGKVGFNAPANTGFAIGFIGQGQESLTVARIGAGQVGVASGRNTSSGAGNDLIVTGGVTTTYAAGNLILRGGSTTGAGANGSVLLQSADGATNALKVAGDGSVLMPSLVTADPHVAGQLWNNSGVLTVSAG